MSENRHKISVINILFSLLVFCNVGVFFTIILQGLHYITLDDSVLITLIIDIGILECFCYYALSKCIGEDS